MTNNLFNSSFEMEIRVASLVCSHPTRLFSTESILAFDFITCYAYSFGFMDDNLHGDNPFMYGEMSSRRTLIQEAVKALVCRGAFDVVVGNGYFYRITDAGKSYVMSLESEYAKEYRGIAEMVVTELGDYSDEDLMKMIQHKSETQGRG